MTQVAAELLHKVSETTPGWTPLDQLLTLFELSVLTGGVDGDILEIGAWCGRSTIALALGARVAGGKVHTVDIFPELNEWQQTRSGDYYVNCERLGEQVAFGEDNTVWESAFKDSVLPVYQKHGSIYDVFRAQLKAFDVTSRVEAHRMSSTQFDARAPEDLQLRLAFIDGDHSNEALHRDIDIVERYLKPNGWICFDDAFTVYGGIDQAIEDRIVKSGRYDLSHQPVRKMFVARRVK